MRLSFLSRPRRAALGICAAALLALVGLTPSNAHAWNSQVYGGQCSQSGTTVDGRRYCDSTVGNAGGQGACCDPQSRQIATCESSNKCTGGSPYKWADSDLPLTWYFNPNNMAGSSGYAGLTVNALEAALKKSFDAWSTPTCTSFRHNFLGTSTSQRPTQQRPNVFYLPSDSEWAQLGAGSSTLAFTRPIPDFRNRSGRLLDADIYFNPRPSGRSWGILPSVSRSQVDFIDVAAHEMGHAIGFAHTSNNALMYYSIRCAGGPCFQGLTQDDKDGVCAIYKRKGPCTKDEECGGCQVCTNSTCTDKSITTIAKVCQPCKTDTDCGGGNGKCVRLEEGNRCVQTCDGQDCCPTGYRCADSSLASSNSLVITACIPEAGSCPDVRCTADTQCGEGESCQSGTCRPKAVPVAANSCKVCPSDNNCGTGNICVQLSSGNRCAQSCVAKNFCPSGYNCRTVGAGRYCIPDGGICPCSSDSDCDSGLVCRNNTCQKSGGGKFNDPCSDTAPCAVNYSCTPTGSGSICLQKCGTSGVPDGSPGSACNGGQCTQGAQCLQGQICFPEICSSTRRCNYGGTCTPLRTGQGTIYVCLCQSDGECGAGKVCNKALMSQVIQGANYGACANKGTGGKCESGYNCTDLSQQGFPACNPQNAQACFCYPGASQDVGQPCGEKRCKAGLVCVRTSANTNDAVCVEDCTSSGTCSTGGSCQQASDSLKVCICQPGSACPGGRTCRSVGQVGVCATGPATGCGNGTCDSGENCGTCPADCTCPSGESCQSNACKAVGTDCGNNACEGAKGENCTTCPNDCGCPAGKFCLNGTCGTCGNNACEGAQGENCTTCPSDCGCPAGKLCQSGNCNEASDCGNNACQGDKGENCSTCPLDCACPAGKTCQNATCQDPTPTPDGGNNTPAPDKSTGSDNTDPQQLNCPASEQYTDENGKRKCAEAPTGGCGCIASPNGNNGNSILFLLLCAFLLTLSIQRRLSRG